MSRLHTDPVELSAEYLTVVKEAEALAWAQVEEEGIVKGRMGSCHAFWSAKKRILERKFGIVWKTPAAMNPHIMID